jgi:hypothetical protein
LVNNLLRFNYFNVVYFGFGGGVFMRYGEYAEPQVNKNLVYKISVTLSI